MSFYDSIRYNVFGYDIVHINTHHKLYSQKFVNVRISLTVTLYNAAHVMKGL